MPGTQPSPGQAGSGLPAWAALLAGLGLPVVAWSQLTLLQTGKAPPRAPMQRAAHACQSARPVLQLFGVTWPAGTVHARPGHSRAQAWLDMQAVGCRRVPRACWALRRAWATWPCWGRPAGPSLRALRGDERPRKARPSGRPWAAQRLLEGVMAAGGSQLAARGLLDCAAAWRALLASGALAQLHAGFPPPAESCQCKAHFPAPQQCVTAHVSQCSASGKGPGPIPWEPDSSSGRPQRCAQPRQPCAGRLDSSLTTKGKPGPPGVLVQAGRRWWRLLRLPWSRLASLCWATRCASQPAARVVLFPSGDMLRQSPSLR